MPEASTSSPVKLPAPVEAIATEQIPVTTKKPFPTIAKSTKKPTTSADPGVSFLPISRVHRIIKADRDIKICSKEAIFLMSKATEFMIGKLTNAAYDNAKAQKRLKTIKYQDLSKVVNMPGETEFYYLIEPIPNAIPLSAALANKKQTEAEELAKDEAAKESSIPNRVSKPPKAPGKGRGRPRRTAEEKADDYVSYLHTDTSTKREGTKRAASTKVREGGMVEETYDSDDDLRTAPEDEEEEDYEEGDEEADEDDEAMEVDN